VIGALGADVDHDYVALGRRLLIYPADAKRRGPPLGETPPMARKIMGIEPAGSWLLLRTGGVGRPGALIVLDVRRPEEPRVVGRLELLRAPLDMAWDGRWVWLARGATGLERVDISDPAAPSIVDVWRPEEAGDRREVRAVAARPDGLVVLDTPPSTGFGQRLPDRLVTLSVANDAVVVLAEERFESPARLWRLDARRAIVADPRQVRVFDWDDPRAPRLEAEIERQTPGLLDFAVADDVLATVHAARSEGGVGYVRVLTFDLRQGGRWQAEQSTRLASGDWRDVSSRGDELLLADGMGLMRVALRPVRRIESEPQVPTRRYVRVVAAADGALAITTDGELDHVSADGTMTRMSAPGVRLRDVAETPSQMVAIVEERGVVELRPAADGKWAPGETLIAMEAAQPWQRVRAAQDTIVAVGADRILAARLPDGRVVDRASIDARPVGPDVVLDDGRIWLVDVRNDHLLGWRLWAGPRALPLAGRALGGAGGGHPAHLAGDGRHLLVADSSDLVYGIDTHASEGPRVAWRLDMPGQVLSLAVHGNSAWVAWLGDDPGLSRLELSGRGGEPRSAAFRGGWIHSLAASGDRAWAIMEGGALARYQAERSTETPSGTPEPSPTTRSSGESVLWLPSVLNERE